MRMAARDVVLLTKGENAVNVLGHHGVLVFTLVVQLLAQVALTD